jgi:hypothetical protein
MRSSGSIRSSRSLAHGVNLRSRPLMILAGRGVLALQLPRPETVTGADGLAFALADSLPRRRAPLALRALRSWALTGTAAGGCAGAGGRARFPYLARAAAPTFASR